MRRATLSCAATVVKKTSGIMAGMPCVWWNYQPKMLKRRVSSDVGTIVAKVCR